MRPSIQFGIEARLPYVDGLSALPVRRTDADAKESTFLADIRSYQHPDHDTDAWPPADREA